MKLKDARDNYGYFSGKASDLVRQLGFAGIALIWVFKITDANAQQSVPQELIIPGFCIVLALALDFIHYVYAAAAWGIYHRHKERQANTTEETDFDAPKQINWPHLVAFWLKIVAIAVAYGFLLKFLAEKLA